MARLGKSRDTGPGSMYAGAIPGLRQEVQNPSLPASSVQIYDRITPTCGPERRAAMTNRFLQLLQDKPFLMADGATGTNLFAAGLMTGDSPETWNHLHPEKITALHQSFVDAGSDIILTNSFGG